MKTQDQEPISFLTDLDTLFDTRMGVLDQYGVEVVEGVVREGYFHRHLDVFHGVDMEDFKRRYAKRDVNVLRKSLLTPLWIQIKKFMTKTFQASITSPLIKRPRLVVNLHPYKLTKESVDVIHQGLVTLTKKHMEVILIDQPHETISLKEIKEGYAMVAFYHYADWLEKLTLNGALVQTQCPQVTLLSPRLLADERGLSLLKITDVFHGIEEYCSLYFKTVLLPVNHFCADLDLLASRLKEDREVEDMAKQVTENLQVE